MARNDASHHLPLERHLWLPNPIMDRVKQKRSLLRASATKIISEMKAMMEVTPLPTGELAEQLNMLKRKEFALTDIDKEIKHLID